MAFSQFLRLRRLCSDDSDFPEKSEAVCQFFYKHGYPVSVVKAGHRCAQQIDGQSALQTTQKENTNRILFTLTFHSHNHAVKSIILKTLNYFKMTLVLSFRNPHYFHSNVTKIQASFWSEVHFEPMTSLELSNALAHGAKLITLRVPPPMSFTA